MKTSKSLLLIFLIAFLVTGCHEEFSNTELMPLGDTQIMVAPAKGKKVNKATGSVEIIWKGGEKGGDMGNKPENLRAFFEFDAIETNSITGAKGNVIFRVTSEDLTIHREISANVIAINFCEEDSRSWFVAKVISDSKGCNGGPGGEGHESGCSGEDDGGCGDDTSHDGGCTDGHTTDDGGCTDTHTDDGGCSGSDMGGPGETDSGSMGSTDKGNPLSGKNCRIGQLIVVKVHDVSTPGALGDEITWKWFAPNSSYNITNSDHKNITVNNSVVHLCKKTIIDGNLVVHI